MATESSLAADINVIWWEIPLTLFQLTFSVIGLVSSIVFISIVVTQHELQQNLALLLAANLSIGGLLFCVPMIVQDLYMLTNYSEPDRLCPLRGYFYVTGLVYTFQATTLQTVHRLFVTVFVHYRQLQNCWLFLFIALAQFSISVVALLPLLFSGHFPYMPDGKVCYIAFNDLLGILYPSCCFYFGPLTVQLLMSWWILRHISQRTQAGRAQINVKKRIRKERRVLVRLALPVILLVGVGLIYFVFVLGTLITGSSWKTPPYALHLSLAGVSAATGMGMLANVVINKQVREIICSTLRCRMMRRQQSTVHVFTQQQLPVRDAPLTVYHITGGTALPVICGPVDA